MKSKLAKSFKQPHRTHAEINQEYNLMAATLGDRYFKAKILQHEIDALSTRLNEINKEASKLPAPTPVEGAPV